jgi:hypothetical protein
MRYKAMLEDIASVISPERALRSNERGVKRKMSNYPIVRRSRKVRPTRIDPARIIIKL